MPGRGPRHVLVATSLTLLLLTLGGQGEKQPAEGEQETADQSADCRRVSDVRRYRDISGIRGRKQWILLTTWLPTHILLVMQASAKTG